MNTVNRFIKGDMHLWGGVVLQQLHTYCQVHYPAVTYFKQSRRYAEEVPEHLNPATRSSLDVPAWLYSVSVAQSFTPQPKRSEHPPPVPRPVSTRVVTYFFGVVLSVRNCILAAIQGPYNCYCQVMQNAEQTCSATAASECDGFTIVSVLHLVI